MNDVTSSFIIYAAIASAFFINALSISKIILSGTTGRELPPYSKTVKYVYSLNNGYMNVLQVDCFDVFESG